MHSLVHFALCKLCTLTEGVFFSCLSLCLSLALIGVIIISRTKAVFSLP